MLFALARWVGLARADQEPTPEPTPDAVFRDVPAFAPAPDQEPTPCAAPIRKPVRISTPKRSARPTWRPALEPPDVHANRLLDWLQSEGGLTGELRVEEIQHIYRHMCADIGWEERPWNPVAREFTRLTTGKKVYRWFDLEDGRHKLRIYPVPTRPRRTDSATRSYRSIQTMRRAA